MKKIVGCLAIGILFAGVVRGQEIQYSFSKERPLKYSFSIDGDVSYQYEGIPGQDFKVLSNGSFTLETIEDKGNFYSVRLTPTRTLVKLNDAVLEDITQQDTARSQIISTAVIEIGKNGEIIRTEEISPGILNLSQMLMVVPVFPEKLSLPWKQTVPAFSLPGVPMCNLKFTYQYISGKEDISKIKLFSNQRIREKRKDGDVDIQFTGLNSSKGEFLFDRGRGEIKSFEGTVELILKTVFQVPPGPEQKVPKQQSLPLTMRIKLNINLSATDR